MQKRLGLRQILAGHSKQGYVVNMKGRLLQLLTVGKVVWMRRMSLGVELNSCNFAHNSRSDQQRHRCTAQAFSRQLPFDIIIDKGYTTQPLQQPLCHTQ